MKFIITDDAIIRYNYKRVKKNEMGKITGREIHVVLEDHFFSNENFKPRIFNIYDFDETVHYYEAGHSGCVIKWKNNFTGVKIWEPHDRDKMMNDLYERSTIADWINNNQMRQEFYLKADYTFSEDFRLIVNGEEKQISSSHLFRDPQTALEVNRCFFYGPTFVKYNEKGEVETIIVPWEYDE